MQSTVALRKSYFGEKQRRFILFGELTVDLFRYETGIEAILMANKRGSLIILPFMGQMIWDARFDGVELAMDSMFDLPRPSPGILGTYGCFLYHSGLLRNGCPSPEDDHPLHGEMPCAPVDEAWISFGEDDEGPWMTLHGRYEYVMGFGSHYDAIPSVTMRAGKTVFDVSMAVDNIGGSPMDLMYQCHVNYAFRKDGRIIQPTGFTPDDVVVRTSVPGHVRPTEEYLSFMKALAVDPALMETMRDPALYDPEFVFYVHNLKTDPSGRTHLMMQRPEGDGFYVSYNPEQLPHLVRWVLYNDDQKVCAFALPSTCEPEGYLAEKRKGNVRSLEPGKQAFFEVRLGYLKKGEAETTARMIESL